MEEEGLPYLNASTMYVCSSLNQVFGKLQAKEMGSFSPSLLMERRDLLSSLDLAIPSHASCVMFHTGRDSTK